MALAARRVDDHRLAGDFFARFEHAGKEELVGLFGERDDHARTIFDARQCVVRVPRRIFRSLEPFLARRRLGTFGQRDVWTSLRHVGIVLASAAAGTQLGRGRRREADLENRRAGVVDRERVVVAGGDGTLFVGHRCQQNRAGRAQFLRLDHANPARETVLHGPDRRVARGDEQAAVFDEAREAVDAGHAEAGAHVVGFIDAAEVWRDRGLAPRQRRAGRKSVHDFRGRVAAAGRREKDHVELLAQVRRARHFLRRDVAVCNVERLQRQPEPTLVLRAQPCVEDGHARKVKVVRFRRRSGGCGDDRSGRVLFCIGCERFIGDDARCLAIAPHDARQESVGVVLEDVPCREGLCAAPGMHRHLQHIRIGDAFEIDVLQIAERPAGVVVHLFIAADVLHVEHRVGETRVRLIHADDEAAFGEIRFLFLRRGRPIDGDAERGVGLLDFDAMRLQQRHQVAQLALSFLRAVENPCCRTFVRRLRD